MLTVKICNGTSCYLKGAYSVIQLFQHEIEKMEFHDKIELIKHLKDDSIRRNETSLQVREQAALTKNLRILLQQTLYRAQMAFGDKSLIVETFRGSEISQLRGIDLILPVQAEALLLQDADKLGDSRPYRFDIIDIQRQIMSNLGQAIHKQAAKAFKEKDKSGSTVKFNSVDSGRDRYREGNCSKGNI